MRNRHFFRTAFLSFVLFYVISFAATNVLFAQGATPVPGGVEWYKSVYTIVAAVGVLVQLIKKSTANVAFLQHVPLWVYAIVVAMVLTYIAENWIHSLTGGLWADENQAIILAAAASGIYSWMSNVNVSPFVASK